jgi:hypothetical protein
LKATHLNLTAKRVPRMEGEYFPTRHKQNDLFNENAVSFLRGRIQCLRIKTTFKHHRVKK